MTTATKVPIHVALAEVAKAVGAIGKNMRNVESNYAARSIDDVLDAVHGPLCDQGVVVIPEVIERHQTERKARGGGALIHVALRTRYHFIGPAGDKLIATVASEAIDSSDKATNKALSAGFKMALIQTLTIPVAGDDADSQTHELAAPEPPAGPTAQDVQDRAHALPENLREQYLIEWRTLREAGPVGKAATIALLERFEADAQAPFDPPNDEGSGG